MRRCLIPLFVIGLTVSGCAMFQTIIKSSFPYTTTLTVAASSQPGVESSAVSMATSFDQNFSKNGNTASKITLVRVISAKLVSISPPTFNIGNIASVKVYLSKKDGSDEILIASRDDIEENAGNNITLDFDDSKFLDELVRQRGIRVRMVYKMRNYISNDVNLDLILGLAAYPVQEKK
ncbi:MAG TPA: hypothetical protein VHB54_20440 [Mucilaginibacter sp.]|nr:hypothetical protein [Mucilaginibacter sp.]